MDTIAGKVIERLTSLALDEFGLIWNLKDDLRRMEHTVSAIRAKLLDAEATASNREVSDWLRKLKDVLFDADDLLDDVSTEALIRRKVMTGNKMAKELKLFFSHSNQRAYGLKMGHKMKEIRKRLDDICNDKIQLQLTDHPVQVPLLNRAESQSYSFAAKDDVIGREEEKKLIISYLLDSNVTDGVSIIPIVGIGGLGKTALAQLVYNDEAVQKHFDPKMWACVSDEFSVKQIAQKMLGQTTNSVVEQVQKDLRTKIGGKKFLLVLDDVWNENRDLWLKLKSLLMEGAKGSMIIVTTRSDTVAKIMHTQVPLVLKGLDDDQSWQLFSRVAFDGGKEPNDPRLVTIGKEIVKKCIGVPLAIRTIGSILYCQNLRVDNWSYFKDTELSKIDHQDNKIFAILKLSYDHLRSDLKNCFAYCSLFTKDFEITRETIIQLWIAQGFIPSSNQTRRPEDVGDEYFMNLLSRSFFQDVKRGKYGEIMTCKMHHLMHDLAKLVAENECVAISKGRRENVGHGLRHLSFDFKLELPSWGLPAYLLESKILRTFMLPFGVYAYGAAENRLRHLPFDFKLELPSWGLPACLLESKELRTFMLPFGLYAYGAAENSSAVVPCCKPLRVLDVHSSCLITIPKSIGKLKHLRYLDLSYNYGIEKLPESITKLHNLQTLKLSGCGVLKELARGINKLVSLRHLEFDGCFSLSWMPYGLGQLTCLQTLTRFALDHERSGSARMSDLSGLSNLREKLLIEGLQHLRGNTVEVKSAKVFLERQCCQELELVWTDNNEDNGFEEEMILQGGQLCHTMKRLYINGFCGKSLPDSIGNLSSLHEIEIGSCNRLTSLPDSIGNLSSMQKIEIGYCYCFTSLPDSIGILSSLQKLNIVYCPGLTMLPDSILNLSSLQKLNIVSCPGLTMLPDSVGNLSSLQKLNIVSCPGLTMLPDSIGNLSSMQNIEIRHCHCLTALPNSIGNLSSLRQLIIKSCHGLTTLPDSIGNLSLLQQLVIWSCYGLTMLPDSIGNLSSLQDIIIVSCHGLTTLPDSIQNLSSLNIV